MIVEADHPSEIQPIPASTLVSAALRRARGERQIGMVKTGFMDLDLRCGGLAPGTLTILGGRVGMGRSALARTICAGMIEDDPPAGVVLHVPNEDPELVITQMLGVLADVEQQRVNIGTIDRDDDLRMIAAADLLRRPGNLFLSYAREQTIASLRTQVEQLRAGEQPVRLVVVERLDLLLQSEASDAREREMATIMRELKQLALDLHLPVLALATASHKLEARKPRWPQARDLTASGAVDRYADLILLLYCPEFYMQDETPVEWQRKAQLFIDPTSKVAPRGSIIIEFSKSRSRFQSLVSITSCESTEGPT